MGWARSPPRSSGRVWVIGIPALAPNNQVLGLLTSSIGLLAVLLYFPRGLKQIAYDVRDAFLAWADRRFGKEVVRRRAEGRRPRRSAPEPEHREAGVPTLAVADLRVTFGGNMAVDGVTLSVGGRRDRRADREQRRRQVDAHERDRWLRPGLGLGAAG